MKVVQLFLLMCVVISGADISNAMFDQSQAVSSVKAFTQVRGPVLYQGNDSSGQCRVMIYPQDDERQMRLWLEGSFQLPEGPVSGVAINVLVSTSTAESRLTWFQMGVESLELKVVQTSANGNIERGLVLQTSGSQGLVKARFSGPGFQRECQNMKRLL